MDLLQIMQTLSDNADTIMSWVRLPCFTIPGVLHIPPFTYIPNIHSLCLQSHTTARASSCIKADDKVNTSLDSKADSDEVWQTKVFTVITN